MIQEARAAADTKFPRSKVAVATSRRRDAAGYVEGQQQDRTASDAFEMTFAERLAWTRAAITKVEAMIEECRQISAMLTKCLGLPV